MTLELDLPKNVSKYSLEELIWSYFDEVTIEDVDCSRCKRRTHHKFKRSIIKPSQVMFIHLKRFEYSPNLRDFKKNTKPVSLSSSMIDLQSCAYYDNHREICYNSNFFFIKSWK